MGVTSWSQEDEWDRLWELALQVYNLAEQEKFPVGEKWTQKEKHLSVGLLMILEWEICHECLLIFNLMPRKTPFGLS